MTEMRSSSNRDTAGICDAVVMQYDRGVGPVRLPESRADDFIDHFNRTYRGLGISLAPQPRKEPQANEKIPGSPKTAGDHDFG